MSSSPRIVGQGSYGCVYKPPIKCKNKKKNYDDKYISKVFADDTFFKDELTLHKRIENIDPRHTFTPAIANTCETNENMIRPVNMMECTAFDVRNKAQIIMENRGISLLKLTTHHRHILEQVKLVTVLKNLLPVVKGVHKIDQKGYAHADIKADNILFDPKTHQTTLIDFGVLQPKCLLYDYDNSENLLCSAYVYYPPEMAMFCDIKKFKALRPLEQMPTLKDWKSVLSTYFISLANPARFDQVKSYFHQHLDDIDLSSAFQNWKMNAENSEKFRPFWNELTRAYPDLTTGEHNPTRIEFIAKSLRLSEKVDVYMLGITIIDMLMRAMNREFREKKDYLGLSQNKAFYRELLPLVNKAIDPNPFTRISIAEFAKTYKRILTKTIAPQARQMLENAAREFEKAYKRIMKKTGTPQTRQVLENAARAPLPEQDNARRSSPVPAAAPAPKLLETYSLSEIEKIAQNFGIKLSREHEERIKDVYISAITQQKGKSVTRTRRCASPRQEEENTTKVWNG